MQEFFTCGTQVHPTPPCGSVSLRAEGQGLSVPLLRLRGRNLSPSHVEVLLDQLLRGSGFPERPGNIAPKCLGVNALYRYLCWNDDESLWKLESVSLQLRRISGSMRVDIMAETNLNVQTSAGRDSGAGTVCLAPCPSWPESYCLCQGHTLLRYTISTLKSRLFKDDKRT